MIRGRWLRAAAIVVSIGAVVGYRILYPAADPFLFLFYLAVVLLLLFTSISATVGRSFEHLPVAEGRYVVLVPVFNENPELLLLCINSLLRQTVPPARIYVIDDGSTIPVPTSGNDPRVVVISQANAGKRQAQGAALAMESGNEPDFILTVDSDSIVESRAVERSLRAFSNPDVQGVTGMPMLLNVHTNILTRLQDLEIVSSCLVGRASRSYLGVVSPATGAFSMYRASLVYDYLDDYLSSGTVGDDRRLAIYGLLRGQVVAINEAVVAVEMPDRLWRCYRQRTRWFKAFWRFLPWEIAVLPNTALFFRVWALTFGILAPIILFYVFIIYPAVTHHFFWAGLIFWMVIGYTQTLPYVTYRPGLSRRFRWSSWIVLSPVMMIWQMFIIRPALFHALVICRSDDWKTR